jgi:predicted PurR-regulated permease PerM
LLIDKDLPPSRFVSQIVLPLWILAFALLLAFCYFASSLCITVLLGSFLAIVADPLITHLERWHIPCMISSAIVIVTGTVLIVTLIYAAYKQVSDVVDELPQYAGRVGQAVAPLTTKIQKVQDSAGRLNNEIPAKKVPEVKVKQDYPPWTSYLIRGVGPMSGAIIIIGVVPF